MRLFIWLCDWLMNVQELIKNTDESHPDKKSLPLALAEMQVRNSVTD